MKKCGFILVWIALLLLFISLLIIAGNLLTLSTGRVIWWPTRHIVTILWVFAFTYTLGMILLGVVMVRELRRLME